MDSRSQNNLNTLHPKIRPVAIQAWTEAESAMPTDTLIVVIEGLRSFAKSDADYAIGRTVMGESPTSQRPMGQTITKAAGGQSPHNYGLAWDFAMITNGKNDYVVGPHWLKVVEIMEKYGFVWGGDFPYGQHDNPHFENRCGYRWRQLLVKYHAGDFIPGTQYLNL